MNDIGKSFFLLRGAQLSEKQHFDIRLRVDGDLSRYQGIRRLVVRMFGDTEAHRRSTRPAMSGQFYGGWDADDHDEEWTDEWDYDAWYGDWAADALDADDWWSDQSYWAGNAWYEDD